KVLSSRVAKEIQRKAALRKDPGTGPFHSGEAGKRLAVLRPAPPRDPSSLRPPPGRGRSAEILGRSQGSDARSESKTPRHDGGRPSDGVWVVRRRHSERELRRGKRHALGSRNLSGAQRCPGRRTACARRLQV